MPAREFRQWQVYEAHEPFGDRLVAATLALVFSKNSEGPAIVPQEFWTSLRPDPEPMDPLHAAKAAAIFFTVTRKSQEILAARQAERKKKREAKREARRIERENRKPRGRHHL